MLAGVGNTLGRDLVGDDSFLSAFLGNDLTRKKLNSQFIEESNDKYGEAFNPNYKNVVDNVAPYAKGPAGFVLDVVADPINLIPGKIPNNRPQVVLYKEVFSDHPLAGAGCQVAQGCCNEANGCYQPIFGRKPSTRPKDCLAKGNCIPPEI